MPSSRLLRPRLSPLLLCLLACLGLLRPAAMMAAELPVELRDAMGTFRTEGPFGWAFTQTSTDEEGVSLVESFDPAQPVPFRWSLLMKDGREPTESEKRDYQQHKVLRTSALDAPRLEQKLDLNSCTIVEEQGEFLLCRFSLKQGEEHDDAHENLSVLVTLHRPTKCITKVEISNLKPFYPVFGVRISSTRTVLTYSLPAHGTPSLLVGADISLKGRAFLVKSMDQHLRIEWSQHRRAGKAQGMTSPGGTEQIARPESSPSP